MMFHSLSISLLACSLHGGDIFARANSIRGSEGHRRLCSPHGDGCWLFDPCCGGLSCHPGIHKCYHSPRREGEPCSAGYGCAGGLTCEAGSHVCRAPGHKGDACHATRPCGSGLSCAPGVHQCYHSPRHENEPCSAGYGCKSGLHCEAGSQKCRAPGREGDACHATRPCGTGLTCEAGSHVCRAPGGEGDACHATRPCGTGLTCEAGSHVCRAPGKHGDHCHATRPCASGYWCVDAVSALNYQQCVPDCTSFESAVEEKIKDQAYSDGGGIFDQKWSGGVVPFQADCELENNELAAFSRAMKHIEEKTSIRFERYDPSKHGNWVIFADSVDGVASSFVGRMKEKGWQRVNLDTDWLIGGHDWASAVHELVHALGWQHTQARPDRNNYVTINEENIEPGKQNNFDASRSLVYDAVQKCRAYDYGSIMHYPGDAFSKNGKDTITTKDSSKQDEIGQRSGLSSQDVTEIQEYYFGTPSCLP